LVIIFISADVLFHQRMGEFKIAGRAIGPFSVFYHSRTSFCLIWLRYSLKRTSLPINQH